MNIAIVYCKRQSYTTGIYCKRAIENLGHNVTFYDRKEWVLRKYDYVIKIDDGEFDVFRVTPWNRTIFWAIDTHTNMDRLVKIGRNADYIFCAQKNGVDKFKEYGLAASWLPVADEYEIEGYPREFQYDVSFVGGIEKGVAPDKRIRIKELFEEMGMDIFFGSAKREQISEIYSSSYIGINILANNDVNMRTFEIPINGALLLMEEVDGNGIEELYDKKTEYVSYDSIDDLPVIVTDILNNKDKYDKVRRAGYDRTLSQHTYTHRMKAMLDQVEKY